MEQGAQGLGDGDAGAAAVGDDQGQGRQDGEEEFDPPGNVQDVVGEPQKGRARDGGQGGVVVDEPGFRGGGQGAAAEEAAAVVGVLEEGDGDQEDGGGGEAQGLGEGDGAGGGAWREGEWGGGSR